MSGNPAKFFTDGGFQIPDGNTLRGTSRPTIDVLQHEGGHAHDSPRAFELDVIQADAATCDMFVSGFPVWKVHVTAELHAPITVSRAVLELNCKREVMDLVVGHLNNNPLPQFFDDLSKLNPVQVRRHGVGLDRPRILVVYGESPTAQPQTPPDSLVSELAELRRATIADIQQLNVVGQ